MKNYSDEERVEIAEKEYRDYKEKEPVKINDNKNRIGKTIDSFIGG
ncbi:hypothetical protein HB952_01015 [Listeria welshimeri]|nr:hypothetical protein [Listeria welshimeri]MBC1405760.1 hypothetical protein [Listeria welshimeri]MBC1626425.1 hypothetical protein [Listeria welshimeri]MBC1638635.1 hypothetical protein [Listeria welshimeri]MBC1659898.1 hypothetical protein [Listeria welshimeri]MBC1671239.1 hypothetical protein [Listeria welshimeri]